jgi:hypothetical protein
MMAATNYDDWLERQRELRDLTELRVLGTCMAMQQHTDTIIAMLDPSMFKRDAHRILADAIWTLSREGKPVTMEKVTDLLIGTDRIDEVGGAVGVYDCYARAEPTVACAEELLTIEYRGKVWAACRDGMMSATNPAVEPADAAADVMAALVRTGEMTTDQERPSMSVGELIAMDPPLWLVDGIIPAGLTVLYGNAKSGKSYLALSIAWAYSTGTSWFRRRCRTTPGRVLYLSGEGLADLSLRSQALIQSTGQKPDDDMLVFDHQPLSLSKDRDAARLRLKVERAGAELVIVDTWARYSGLRDENDAAQASRAIAALEQLTTRGVSVILIHHANTTGDLRGSTALGGAVESSIRVIKSDQGMVEVTPDMTRRGPGFTGFALKFVPTGPDAVLQEPWWKPVEPQQTLV